MFTTAWYASVTLKETLHIVTRINVNVYDNAHRDGHLDSAALVGYSKSLRDTLHLLMHPDPAHRPSAQFLATHLYSHYPAEGTKKSVIFDTHSEYLLEDLMRENAALKAKLAIV